MDDEKKSRHGLWQRLMLWVVPRVAALAIRILSMTLRYEDILEPGSLPQDNPQTRVYCFWHRCLVLAAWEFHWRDIAILISRSTDGELIARTVELMGFKAVRGSSSRGGAAGLRGMQRALETTWNAAFTADGPRGPLYVVKPGAVRLASWVGGGVGMFHLLPERAWELRSWDKFLIPKPFSRVIVSWVQPVPVPLNCEGAEFDAALAAVQNGMDRARANAERHLASGKRAPRLSARSAGHPVTHPEEFKANRK